MKKTKSEHLKKSGVVGNSIKACKKSGKDLNFQKNGTLEKNGGSRKFQKTLRFGKKGIFAKFEGSRKVWKTLMFKKAGHLKKSGA